jgi:hypothetical protein
VLPVLRAPDPAASAATDADEAPPVPAVLSAAARFAVEPAAVTLLAIVSLSGNKTVSCRPKQLDDNAPTISSEQRTPRDVDEVKDIFCHDL